MFKDIGPRLFTIGHFCGMGGLCGVLLITKMLSPFLLFWVALGIFVIAIGEEWRKISFSHFPKLFWGGVAFLAVWTVLVSILFYEIGWDMILMGITVAAITDHFAYVWGNIVRGPKLCPSISAQKTWSGFLGSILSTSFIFAHMVPMIWPQSFPRIPHYPFWFYIIICFFAHMGDLGESFLKRIIGVKDMSTVFPGHGGILDRVDSWMGVLFFFSLMHILL